jgi:membrane-associated phospholipid phosphatase
MAHTRWRRTVGIALAMGLLAAACGSDSDDEAGRKAEPTAGTWKPWLLSSPSDIPVPPPPAKGSDQEKAEDQEIKDLAARRTAEVKDIVRKWAAEGEPVSTPWVEMNLEFVAAREKDPPLSSRGYALMSVAVYDAMVATWHYKYQYNREAPDVGERLADPGPDPSYPSEHAAIAGAASRVLAYLFPERPALRLDESADQAADSRVMAGANRRSDVDAGLDLGHRVAEKVIAYAKADGAEKPCNKRAPGGPPRYWAPPPGSVANPVQPCAGEWKTWAMTSGSQFRPGPPPAFGSPEFLAQAREVVAAKNALTEEQKKAATFWAGGQGTPLPAGVWMNVLLAYLRDRVPTEPQAERTLALAAVAMSDAGVASWDAKYAYWDPRPENGVRDSGIDKNWEPYIETPFFPSYVSGHATYSGAAAEVMTYLFPDDAAEFNAKADEASNSRMWGGIHWRADNEVGLAVGRQVGALVVERAKTDGGGTD